MSSKMHPWRKGTTCLVVILAEMLYKEMTGLRIILKASEVVEDILVSRLGAHIFPRILWI